ncbi:hypothetical protein SAMN04487869_101409 [Marinobacter sp. DSM 26671]|uniref:DUF6522 family protein n=1 Tax=Marinobacter sp. DSM 26671 TaxID=1761793 RepID=UPI0008DEF82B|nr:DUF6522 family protein [Marinobacter sp. DSM 26671]SFD96487.1 hypothetical protein SAMN04487869_101409 [Marinobacter sp. DSM 26671]
MKTIAADSIEFIGSEIIVDAELLAALFDVSVSFLRKAMAAGRITTLVERGEGEDFGRTRITFRYSGQQVSMMRETNGQLHETEPPAPDVRAVKPSLMHLIEAG